jgi:hypothetical protein
VPTLTGQVIKRPITILCRLIRDCVPFLSPLTTRRDYGGSILTRLHTGHQGTCLYTPKYSTFLHKILFYCAVLEFSFLRVVHTGSGVYASAYPLDTGNLSPGVKRPGSESNHSPPTSAEVKKTWVNTTTPPTRLYGVVLNLLTTGSTLPLPCILLRE